MTVNEYKNRFLKELPLFYDEMERLNLFYLSMEFVLDFTKSDCVLKQNEKICDTKQKQFENIIVRLKQNEPIQYITGKAYFFGFEFKVSPDTLIPRPETEELVDWILGQMKQYPEKKWRILDIGTGTGCIPITIKKEFPLAEVSAIDISEEALAIAKENAGNLHTEVSFFQADIFQLKKLDAFDIIVSNPPYVRCLEKNEINDNVLQHEPHLALFVEDRDPLIFYRKITELATESLTEKGLLFFEINQYLSKEMNNLVSRYFKNVEIKKDFMGNERMLKASN